MGIESDRIDSFTYLSVFKSSCIFLTKSTNTTDKVLFLYTPFSFFLFVDTKPKYKKKYFFVDDDLNPR